MANFKFIIFLITLLWGFNSFGQEITNVRVTQEGKTVVLTYNLTGKPGEYDVNIYYTLNDGKSWEGPLKNVSGDITNQKTGVNKQAIWNAAAEKETFEGTIQFKLYAVPVRLYKNLILTTTNKRGYPPSFYKYKKSKTIWLSGALVSGAVGVFSMMQANDYYSQYQTAIDNAADLHQKVKLYDQITPIAFGVAGLCSIEFILKAGKQGKAKKQTLSFTPVSIKNGAGIDLAYSF